MRISDRQGVAFSVINLPLHVASECSARAITNAFSPSHTHDGLNTPCLPKLASSGENILLDTFEQEKFDARSVLIARVSSIKEEASGYTGGSL